MREPTAGDGRAVITGWSALSPFGVGRAAFTEGLHTRAATAAPAATLDPAPHGRWPEPDQRACLVPDFTISGVLGAKGTRSMDRVTGLAVATVGRLLTADGGVPFGADTAVVLGTTTGSVQSMMDFTRESLVGRMPFFVDPARFPNTVMNCAAGQCAIWYGLRGPNATVAGGRLAGLHALAYAHRLLRAGRAPIALCGGVEEFSPARSWLEWHARGADERAAVLGEGCAVLVLEPAESGTQALAEVLAVEFGAYRGDDAGPHLAACVRRALRRAGIGPDAIWAVSTCAAPAAKGRQERAAVADVLGDRAVVEIRPDELIGDTSGASAAFQVIAVLATAERAADPRGRAALVTAVDSDGVVGCALLAVS